MQVSSAAGRVARGLVLMIYDFRDREEKAVAVAGDG
jgi:hypothetical protein